jgi:hypothetical protein
VYENKDISCKNTTYSKYDAKYLHWNIIGKHFNN